MNKLREKLLSLLENNSRLKHAELAVMTGTDINTVESELNKLTSDGIIAGFNTLINWDKTDREFVSALIEVKVTPQRGQGFDIVAKRIYGFDEVKAVYLMSGGFDLTVIVQGKTIKDVAYFVSDKLAPMESVLSTATHFVLKKYKDHGIILDGYNESDERMIISP